MRFDGDSPDVFVELIKVAVEDDQVRPVRPVHGQLIAFILPPGVQGERMELYEEAARNGLSLVENGKVWESGRVYAHGALNVTIHYDQPIGRLIRSRTRRIAA